MKRERNLWKSVDMLAIRVKGVRDELSSYRVRHEGGEEVIGNEMGVEERERESNDGGRRRERIMKGEEDGEKRRRVGHGSSGRRRIKLKESKSGWRATSWYLFVCCL